MSDPSNAVAAVGTLASITGVIITGLTLRKTAAIQRDLFARTRLQPLLKALREHNSGLSRLLDDQSSSAETYQGQFLKMDVILRNIEQKWESVDVDNALAKGKNIKRKRLFNRDALGEFYALSGAVIVGVEQAIEDRKWNISQ